MSKKNSAPVSNKEKAGALYRIVAVLMVVVSIAALFLPYANVLVGASSIEKDSLFNNLLTGSEKLFGILPMPMTAGTTGKIVTIILYMTVFMSLLCAILCLLSLFTKKAAKRIVPFATYLFTFGFAMQAICFTSATGYLPGKIAFDPYTIAIALFGALMYLIMAMKKLGKVAFGQAIMFLLTVAVASSIFASIALSQGAAADAFNKKPLYKTIILAIFVLMVLHMFFGSIRIYGRTKKFDKCRYILALLIVIVACVLSLLGEMGSYSLTFTIAAIFIAAIQVGIAFIVKPVPYAEEADEDEEMEEDEDDNEYRMEEYAEAYAYEGGPVDGVEMAEEVTPTFQEVNTPVNTAGYDFYNCQSFDPFIATLNMEERNQFTEIFILKFKGVMPEIPDYVVGGDNREFFRKIFIYLGQYRERIPSGLLAKIYQFSIKLS